MADEDETVVVSIEGEGETDTALADPVAELKAQYEDLQRKDEARERQLTESRRREQEALRVAQQATEEVKTARSETADSQADSIAAGLAAAQSESESASGEYASAMEAGDFARAAKAQRRMASAEAKIVRLDEAKSDLEARKVEVPKRETVEARQPTVADDPVEAYVAGRTEPTAKWLRAHPTWVTDRKKNAQLTSAHWAAVAEGLEPDTDEYFSHVETLVGLKKAPTNGATNGAVKPQRRPSMPVAPVGASGGSNGGGDNEVVLSKREANAATDGTVVWNYDDTSPQKRFKKGDPVGIQEFARRKREMKKQGLYDKSYTEA